MGSSSGANGLLTIGDAPETVGVMSDGRPQGPVERLAIVDLRRRLRLRGMRRGSDRVFAGVASGIADALRVDPIIVRVGFVVLAVAGGVGVPLYFVLWFLMPGPDGERHLRGTRLDRF